jgi:hypothetical protein
MIKCKLCDCKDTIQRNEITQRQMEKEKLCFNCWFWLHIKKVCKTIRANGKCWSYNVQGATQKLRFKSLKGGTTHYYPVRFEGLIPERFKDILEDNVELC